MGRPAAPSRRCSIARLQASPTGDLFYSHSSRPCHNFRSDDWDGTSPRPSSAFCGLPSRCDHSDTFPLSPFMGVATQLLRCQHAPLPPRVAESLLFSIFRRPNSLRFQAQKLGGVPCNCVFFESYDSILLSITASRIFRRRNSVGGEGYTSSLG